MSHAPGGTDPPRACSRHLGIAPHPRYARRRGDLFGTYFGSPSDRSQSMPTRAAKKLKLKISHLSNGDEVSFSVPEIRAHRDKRLTGLDNPRAHLYFGMCWCKKTDVHISVSYSTF